LGGTFDLFKAGSFAAFQTVDARIVAHKPRSLDFGAAAAVPLVALTAWEPLFENLRLPLDGSASDRVFLFIGGAGGGGSVEALLAQSSHAQF
jgi:NADPH:quinone reductase-like Zn-dependent oxidoreductase